MASDFNPAPIPDRVASLELEETEPQKIAYLRARAIGRLSEACVRGFLANRDAILAGTVPHRAGLLDLFTGADAAKAAAIATIKTFNRKTIYFHPRKIEFEIGAKDVIGKALEVFAPVCLDFSEAGGNKEVLRHRDRQILSLMQDYEPRAEFSPSECLRCAIDFVAGMTDDYASYLAARLRGLDP